MIFKILFHFIRRSFVLLLIWFDLTKLHCKKKSPGPRIDWSNLRGFGSQVGDRPENFRFRQTPNFSGLSTGLVIDRSERMGLCSVYELSMLVYLLLLPRSEKFVLNEPSFILHFLVVYPEKIVALSDKWSYFPSFFSVALPEKVVLFTYVFVHTQQD